MQTTDITTKTDFPFFRDIVLMPLGDCMVDVELEDSHVNNAYHRAKQMFINRANIPYAKRYLSFPVEKQKIEYDLPTDPKVDTAVKFIRGPGALVSGNDPMYISAIEQLFGYNATEDGDRSMMLFNLTQQKIDILERYLTHHSDFTHDPRHNKIYLENQPKFDEDWLLECYIQPTDDELMDELWIQEWTTAECKIMIGNAYKKLGNITTPSGDVQLNGDGLVQQGQEEKKKLLEDIANLVDSGHPVGMPISIG
jgi:hypothetical protein